MGGAITHDHEPLTNKPSWRLLVLRLLLLHRGVKWLLPLHRLVQRQAKVGEGGGGGGGVLSNLQRFKAHHPLTFMGGGDLMVANHWFQ